MSLEDRAALNAKINEIRADLKSRGMVKPAFEQAFRLWKMDPDDQTAWRESFEIACEALGVNYQRRLDLKP